METRRMIVAVLAAIAVFLAVSVLLDKLMPTQPAQPGQSGPAVYDPGGPPPTTADPGAGRRDPVASTLPGQAAPFRFESVELADSTTLGGRDGQWRLEATFSQRGAAMESLSWTPSDSAGSLSLIGSGAGGNSCSARCTTNPGPKLSCPATS